MRVAMSREDSEHILVSVCLYLIQHDNLFVEVFMIVCISLDDDDR